MTLHQRKTQRRRKSLFGKGTIATLVGKYMGLCTSLQQENWHNRSALTKAHSCFHLSSHPQTGCFILHILTRPHSQGVIVWIQFISHCLATALRRYLCFNSRGKDCTLITQRAKIICPSKAFYFAPQKDAFRNP